ncbi:hypothetical protein AgCh_004950 [Apium graveolens]
MVPGIVQVAPEVHTSAALALAQSMATAAAPLDPEDPNPPTEVNHPCQEYQMQETLMEESSVSQAQNKESNQQNMVPRVHVTGPTLVPEAEVGVVVMEETPGLMLGAIPVFKGQNLSSDANCNTLQIRGIDLGDKHPWYKRVPLLDSLLDYAGSDSIRSLGKDNSTGVVTKVVLDNAFLRGTTNGLRIKTWQEAIFRVIAAILHLGNIEFVKGKEADSSILKDDKSKFHLKMTAKLLMCEAAGLEDALCKRVMITPEEVIKRSLDPLSASVSRDGLAKTLYSRYLC